MKHRGIKILAKVSDKKVYFYVDGVLKFADVFQYASHALDYANALAERYSHHNPVVTLDMRGVFA